MTALIISLIFHYSNEFGICPMVASAVIQTESSFNVDAVGKQGEIGLFQLMPSSFPAYTVKQLKDPRINIKLGIEYLAKMKKMCKHKRDLDYLTCYNFGIKNAEKVKYPHLFPYVKHVKINMERMRQ